MRVGVVQTVNAPPDMIGLAAGRPHPPAGRQRGAASTWSSFPSCSWAATTSTRPWCERAAQARAALARLQAAVDKLGVSCVVGVPDLRDGVLYDAVAILRPGREPGRYAKTHLFRAEKELFTPGAALWTGEIAGWQCGVLVCYELAFPEVARALALSGARLLIVPAAFGKAALRIWQIATVSRAIENGCYLAAAGHAGAERRRASSPATAASSTPPASCWPTPATAPRCSSSSCAQRIVDEVRAGRADSHAGLTDRRPELYGALTEPRAQPGD